MLLSLFLNLLEREMARVKTVLLIILTQSSIIIAHQPIMDMAPRWNGGYGIQLRYERFGSDKFINGSNSLNRILHETMWLEGVFTWTRSKRITFKLPFYQITDGNEIDNYIGGLILALPLKKYSNFNQHTQNFGITPQLQLPNINSKTSDKSQFGGGLSVSYSSETFSSYQLYDIYLWNYNEKDPMLGFDVNLGIHPYHNNSSNSGFFAIWDVTAKWTQGSTTILSGPVLMPYYQNIIARLEVKFPLIENGEYSQFSRGLTINAGIGFVF